MLKNSKINKRKNNKIKNKKLDKIQGISSYYNKQINKSNNSNSTK